MKEFAGTPGTITSLVMRVLQIVHAIAVVTVISFTDIKLPFILTSILRCAFHPHLYLIFWSFLCGIADAYALWKRRKVHIRFTLFMSLIVDWIFVFGSLGIVSIYADLLDLFIFDSPGHEVKKIQIFLVLVSLGCIPTVVLSLIQLWILPVPLTNVSQPDVHPLPAAQVDVEANNNLPRMEYLQGMSGTIGGLVLRLIESLLSLVSLVLFCVMVAKKDFPLTNGFRYLLGVVGIEFLWSISVAIVDIYAMFIGRRLLNLTIVRFFAIGDGVISVLVYTAICGSLGVIFVIDAELHRCSSWFCGRLLYGIVVALASWLVGLISFFFNYWSLASI